MAKNDVILLDGIIDGRVAERLPSDQRDEVFEFFVLEELLKDYDLSRDDLEEGWIDGDGDGGIDAFYVLINGILLDESADFVWPRSDAAIDVWIITCKHHDTFRQVTLDVLIPTIQEVFDLGIDNAGLQGKYSEDLLSKRAAFAAAYRRLSIGNPALRFRVVYASRGDTGSLGEHVVARAQQIEKALATLFSSCRASCDFVGATQLIEAHRRAKRFALELPFQEHLATGRNSYVLLVRLLDYFKFVTDEGGALRRYLFDSNVRDFLGSTGINEDIARSLQDERGPDFWWLNNGVTILATNATAPGKVVQLQDIQIVNGLQTTETIYRHFTSGKAASGDRSLLVKVVVTSDAATRDLIIRATNNQNPVELAALHATDKIQRDIETILERHEWYYERRRNYYRNIGKPQSRFVTPIYLASAAVSLILRNPRVATRLKPKFMRSQAAYEGVFSSHVPIEVWPALVDVYKSVDKELPAVATPPKRGERFLSNWRPLIALLIVARRLGTFGYSPSQLVALTEDQEITATEVRDAWSVIEDVSGRVERVARPKPAFVTLCCEEAGRRFGIAGLQAVGVRTPGSPESPRRSEVSDDTIAKVDGALPTQPWEPGMHLSVAKRLALPTRIVQEAIQILIARGKRHVQRDGVVYDATGAVIAVDPDRVQLADPENKKGSAESEADAD
jgi:hypothetical protein